MLSILIPTYNYNILPLVERLFQEAVSLNIEFEILCQDDASDSPFNSGNKKINELKNCFFYVNSENLGRGMNRNSLAQKARNKWLLFLDADTFPASASFIKNYLLTIENNIANVAFGGIAYEDSKPSKEKLLRWVYGKEREAIHYLVRKKNPYNTALTSNLLIKKTLFLNHPFNSSITKYGYEDLVFIKSLKDNNVPIEHIDNAVFHLNLETSELFLEKTKTALENLFYISQSGFNLENDSKIVSKYNALKRVGFAKTAGFIFRKTVPFLEANILSENPKLLLFDLYKLGYFCGRATAESF